MDQDTVSISIDQARSDEFEALLDLYVDLFFDREPLTTLLGLSRERIISIAGALYASSKNDVLSQGLCWIARDSAEGGRGVGFIVCDDPTAAGAPRLPEDLAGREAEMVAAVGALLEEIRRPVKDRLAPGAGKCLHIAGVGVAPGYEGRGIAGRLLGTALQAAGSLGFRHALSECTSVASRRLHEKFGFECRQSVSTRSIVVNGSHPFPDRDLEIYLMWKVLD